MSNIDDLKNLKEVLIEHSHKLNSRITNDSSKQTINFIKGEIAGLGIAVSQIDDLIHEMENNESE
jgi:hypothetical protein